ncbi:MAG: cytochrome PufQ [Pseudomonadota bacterium]
MTDMTTEFADEDTRSSQTPAQTRRKGQTEFAIYFAVIFVATLPLATLTWAMQAIKTRSFTEKGPMARAWTQARIITPMIFSA